MSNKVYADYQNDLVRSIAYKLTQNTTSDREKLGKIFYYVRDEIKFGFPVKNDLVKASETIKSRMGQCNNKSTLFLALCKAVGITAKIHFSLISKEIQSGLFTGLAYRLIPSEISHSWVEVYLEGKWRRIDSYINDEPFFRNAKIKLKASGKKTGFSISCSKAEASSDFNIDEEGFVQMGAVTEDHGLWDDPGDYYSTSQYKNRPNLIKILLYRLMIGRINKKVERIRKGH
ncbi:MAG: transglutaminase-like domain-containing protein [Candidatus Lokiarchaeota archaeon]|nr:transglutaminase-like domain-containing protein [Candidatus Harpocratesius repetitus]